METPIIVLAYAAAGTVAALLTWMFMGPIDRTLEQLIPPELAPAWSLFAKFGLFVGSFTGGMPLPAEGRYVGFQTPVVTPPVPGDGLNLVMKSAAGAMKSGSWLLLVFFLATLAVYAGLKSAAAFRKRREEEAREVAKRQEENKREKERQDKVADERMEAAKRQAPAAPRPVQKDATRGEPAPRS